MVWIKQPDGTYVKQETTEVINLDDLNNEINELENELQSLESKRLKYPNDADDRMKEAIDLWNEQNINLFQSIIISKLEEKRKIKDEINDDNL